ncbi:hypothetical protein [Pseudobacteriovorax antillogorgiicola]|uniref:Uncharacterized protein n=1 Tax=Pseudobacteriovorax antillogorgiicola TaxID=1513793 RepID=A0A1Y6BNI8_9BACT|nr:hypothetical protein [Pseudobacteriovorax antillogorgiicola]TCS53936.1 hypothetical protein EDD56_107248 [Pseudobacteriovorax antillogorgiicola]SMF20329.1 hypothetical protein SAMN06296036_10724 [Pseudobacteriovorax antillogorgiicola]
MTHYPFLNRSYIQERQAMKRAAEEHERAIRHDHMVSHLRMAGVIVGAILCTMVLPIAFILGMIYAPIVAVLSIGGICLWAGYTIGKRGFEKRPRSSGSVGASLEGLSDSRMIFDVDELEKLDVRISGVEDQQAEVISLKAFIEEKRLRESQAQHGKPQESIEGF